MATLFVSGMFVTPLENEENGARSRRLMTAQRYFRCPIWIFIILALSCVSNQSTPQSASVSKNENKRAAEEDRRAWTVTDSWYREPPNSWGVEAVRIDDSLVHVVIPSQQVFAQSKLANSPFQSINLEEASTLVGETVSNIDGLQYYLMRAVFLNEGTGKFFVYMRGTEILTAHGSLGRSAVPMRRAALVVLLAQPPSEVFATCSMAE